MIKIDDHDFKIRIHDGWLVATESTDRECYPGMLIFYSKDGETYSWDDLVTVVEQNAENDKIQTDLYMKDQENCICSFYYESGELL